MGVQVQLHSFLTLALDGGEWSTSRLGRFTPRKETGTHYIGGRVDPRDCLNVLENKNFLTSAEI
jgi:hypothetical protein